MKLDKLTEIETLLRSSKSLIGFNDRYKEETSKPACDKYGKGFNKDGRFSTFSVPKISFDSWTGYYGNSGCSTMSISISQDNAREYFLKALNSKQDEILELMAKYMEQDAVKMKNDAKEEIKKASELLSKLL